MRDRGGAAQPQNATASERGRSPRQGSHGEDADLASLDEYKFVVGSLVDVATLRRAIGLARRWNVTPHDVLLANGWLRPRDYYRALARHCGTGFVEASDITALAPPSQTAGPREVIRSMLLRRIRGKQVDAAYAPGAVRPGELKSRLAGNAGRVALTTPRIIRSTIQRAYAARLMTQAIHGLSRRYPGESAGQGLTNGQRIVLALTFIMLCAAPAFTSVLHMLAVAGVLFYALVVGLRVVACINIAVSPPGRVQPAPRRIDDADLPVYTILVPLFRERAVLVGLTRALMRLDYPAAKLDIKLVFESVDKDTLALAKTLDLPANFDFIVVPEGGPRTKPKALNYALQFARGEFVVIYDAEDQPEPAQLRMALAAFASGPANLACVQARLTLYNGVENWLTKQFAIEYAALFCGILPTLQRLDLPIPLGGTSNHFRTAALRWLGAWDAFNVTEDADLGMRLYRHGYVCRILASDTSEEAPCRVGPWLYQRTRWLKGWMQTYFVHMRRPAKLYRQLGPWRFAGFQVTIGGMIVSALVHPVFYMLVAMELTAGTPFMRPSSVLGIHIWLLGLFNVIAGFLASMALSAIAIGNRGIFKRNSWRLILHVMFMPAYWLLISAAAYRAVLHIAVKPTQWEKTEHGVSRFARGRGHGGAMEPRLSDRLF